MKFEPLAIQGAFRITSEPIGDERGWFARAFCQRELADHGIDFQMKQVNRSFSLNAGTIRGFHFQFPPHSEQKFALCLRGALLDVIVDLRPESPTFLHAAMIELHSEQYQGILIPERCCHALQTLRNETEIHYQVSAFYAPDAEFGLRWDDPQLDISWPLAVSEISAKDGAWPLLSDSLATIRARMAEPGA